MATFTQYQPQSPYALIPSMVQGLVEHGDGLESPMLTEGSTLETDGYGLRTFRGTFLFKNSAVAPNLAIGWNQFNPGQELFDSCRLFVTKSSRKFRSGGMVEVEVEAIGIDVDEIGGYQTLPCIEGAGSAAATPIEMHPEFEMKIGGNYKDRKNGAIFDPITKKFTGFSTDTTGSAVTSLLQPLAGVKTYLEPRGVIRGHIHAEYANTTAVGITQDIGKQSADGIYRGIKLVPEWYLPAGSFGETFLLTSATIEPLANITRGQVGTPQLVKLNYELTISGRGGWNSLIYPSA